VADNDVRVRDALLIGLTVAAGGVDAISYLGLGQVFTAIMKVLEPLKRANRGLLHRVYGDEP